MKLLPRLIANAVTESLRSFPAVGIIGPRQIGKTTLAKAIVEALPNPSTYLDLQVRDERKLA